jgi:hypothetical protein
MKMNLALPCNLQWAENSAFPAALPLGMSLESRVVAGLSTLLQETEQMN